MSDKDNTKTEEFVSNANSKIILNDYYSYASNDKLIMTPDFNPKTALEVIKNDPIVKGAIITKVDKVLEAGWRITGIDKKSRKKDLEQKLRELRFNKLLRKILFSAILYNNSFVEIVKKGGEVSDINFLDPDTIDIITERNGDIIRYEQKNVHKANNSPIVWSKDSVWHFKHNDLSSNVWAELDMKAIYDTILIKDKIRQWIYWFFKTNQSKGLFNIKQAGEAQIRNFISYLKASESDPTKPVILEGEIEYQLLRKFSEEGMSLYQMLEWCDTQILSLLQVPPVAVGKMDTSGRSNSVEAYSALATAVYGIQQALEDDITYDLFLKIGFPKCIFQFGVLDYVNEEKIFKIVSLMKQSEFSDEAIIEWMNSQGLIFDTNKVFSTIGAEQPKKVSDTYIQGTGRPLDDVKSKADISQRFNPKSTRDEQLVKNSFGGVTVPNPLWVL